MKKDGRKLDRRAQEAIRLVAVEREREGETPSDVVSSYGMNRTTIHKWLHRTKGKGVGLRKLKARKATGRGGIRSQLKGQVMVRHIQRRFDGRVVCRIAG